MFHHIDFAFCTNLLIMSTSDDVVSQKKKDDELVNWREYEALKSHLTRVFNHTTDAIDKNIQDVQVTLGANVDAVATIQTQVTAINNNVTALQRSLDALTIAIGQRQQYDDAHDDEEASNAGDGQQPQVGRGRAPQPVHGRGFAPIGRAQRIPHQPVDDGLGKPKFSIPKFDGSIDPEDYLTWELKIEKLWRLYEYTEEKKVKLAASEFDGYALRWWDALVQNRRDDNDLPVMTWREMKRIMKERFVPTNYLRSVFDKLTNLRQGTMSVDEYYMEMEMLMQRARVRESLEMTMQRFLNNLKLPIKSIVRHHRYETMNELLHHAREAESQLAEEAKARARFPSTGRFSVRSTPPPHVSTPNAAAGHTTTPSSKPTPQSSYGF